MAILALTAGVGDALKNADTIASGLEAGPIRYVAALSLMVNLGLFVMLMRVQSLRVAELKEQAKEAERLGGILEQHNQTTRALDKLADFVTAQLPKKKQAQMTNLANPLPEIGAPK